jgi:MFS family permease
MSADAARPVYRDPNLQIIFGVTLMAVMAVSSVTPAFPQMVRTLGISPQEVGLLVTAYTLPGAILTPFLGVLADRIGRKRVLVPSLLLFAVAGAACAFVRDMESLIVLRLVQGIGGAPLGALNVTIIGDLFDGRRRADAIGLNATVLSVGTAGYPILGGALATIAWYWPFALPVLAIPVGLFALLRLDNPEPDDSRRLGEYTRGLARIVRQPEVLALLIASVIIFIFLFGSYLTYLPELIETRFAPGSFVTGLVLAGSSVGTGVMASQLGRLSSWVGPRRLIQVGFLIDVVALVLMPLVPTLWLLPVVTVLFGTAQGLCLPAIQTLLTEAAPREMRGAFLALNGTVFRLGQTLGPLLMGAVLLLGSTSLVFYAGALLAVAGGVMVVVLLRTPEPLAS